MDRVNGEDTVDIGGGRRGFQAQNAAAGIPGTELTAAYLNGVQEEIMAVIENAGMAADPNDWSQLWKALKKLNEPGYREQINWLAVRAIDVTAPPANAQPGDAYLIPAGATGGWLGKDGRIAVRDTAGWIYFTAKDGHGIGLPDGRIFIRVNGVYREKTEKKASIIAGKGLSGGGRLDADRTLSLSPDTLQSLSKADSAVQPDALSNYGRTDQDNVWTGENNFYGNLINNGIAGPLARQYPYFIVRFPDGESPAGGLSMVPEKGGAHTELAYLPGGGVRIYVEGGGDVVKFRKDGQALFKGNVHAGAASLATDGNIWGSVWTSWGAPDAYGAINKRVEAIRGEINKIWGAVVTDTRFDGYVEAGSTGANHLPSGFVVTGGFKKGGSHDQFTTLYGHQPQVYIASRGWVPLGGW